MPASVATNGTPVELLDVHDAAWSTPKRTAAWMEAHRLPTTLARMRTLSGPIGRHSHAAQAWALDLEMVRVFSSGGVAIDWHQFRDAGIPWDGGARITECLEYAGVSITTDNDKNGY